jgi:hypothetical protein
VGSVTTDTEPTCGLAELNQLIDQGHVDRTSAPWVHEARISFAGFGPDRDKSWSFEIPDTNENRLALIDAFERGGIPPVYGPDGDR